MLQVGPFSLIHESFHHCFELSEVSFFTGDKSSSFRAKLRPWVPLQPYRLNLAKRPFWIVSSRFQRPQKPPHRANTVLLQRFPLYFFRWLLSD